MRVVISIVAILLVLASGAKTELISVSKAAEVTDQDCAPEDRLTEDRAFEAVVLGQTRPDATSGELIDAAVTRGEIRPEHALLYGVYLACGDPRLPAQFHGQDLGPAPKNILWEADVDWTSLSPDIRQALHDFFTEGSAARAGFACADEIKRLMSNPGVWWTAGLQEQNGELPGEPVKIAST